MTAASTVRSDQATVPSVSHSPDRSALNPPGPERRPGRHGPRQHRRRRDPIARPASAPPRAAEIDQQLGNPLRIDPSRRSVPAAHRPSQRSQGVASPATQGGSLEPARRGCRASLMRWVEAWLALASPPSSITQNQTVGPSAATLLDRHGGLQLHRAQLKPQRLALAGRAWLVVVARGAARQ
jgi:hypothetical protein